MADPDQPTTEIEDATKSESEPGETSLSSITEGMELPEGSDRIIERYGDLGKLFQGKIEADNKIHELLNGANGVKPPASEAEYVAPDSAPELGGWLKKHAFESKLSQEQYAGMTTAMQRFMGEKEQATQAELKKIWDQWEADARQRHGTDFESRKAQALEAVQYLSPDFGETMTLMKAHAHPQLMDLMLTCVEQMGGDSLISHFQTGSSQKLPEAGDAARRMQEILSMEKYKKGADDPIHRDEEWTKLYKEFEQLGKAVSMSE